MIWVSLMARLAFFGTPEFSLPTLEVVARFCREQKHELVLVVSQPDQEQGRGRKLLPPPIKIYAEKLGVTVAQPRSLKKNTHDGDSFYEYFVKTKIDLAVVVAYGKIISQRLLSAAPLGFVNLHGSLLPKLRGAAPVQRAIAQGEYETGISLMSMVLKLDAGDVFDLIKTPILASDTSVTLFRRLSWLGAHLLYQHLDDLLHKAILAQPQGEIGLSYASMLNKEEALIDFRLPGQKIAHLSRALDPWPNLYGFIAHKRVKFFDGFFIGGVPKNKQEPGTIMCLGQFLGLRTIDGIVYFQRMQVEGKTILPISEARRGMHVNIGDRISHL